MYRPSRYNFAANTLTKEEEERIKTEEKIEFGYRKYSKYYYEELIKHKYKQIDSFELVFTDNYYSVDDSYHRYFLGGERFYKILVPEIRIKGIKWGKRFCSPEDRRFIIDRDNLFPRNKLTDADIEVLQRNTIKDALIRYGWDKEEKLYSVYGKIVAFILEDGSEYKLHGPKLPYRFGTYYEEGSYSYNNHRLEFCGFKHVKDNIYEAEVRDEYVCSLEEWLGEEWLDELNDCYESEDFSNDPF